MCGAGAKVKVVDVLAAPPESCTEIATA